VHLEPIFIIGAQKCGTSTLHHWLTRHPQIAGARDRDTCVEYKEPDYFHGSNWDRGFQWYQNLFTDDGRRPLDATPDYFSRPATIELIADKFPRAKFVFSLRCPVRRAISGHNHYCQGYQDNPLLWDWRCPGESLEANVMAEQTNPFPAYAGLIGRGMYAAQLQELARFFPREQILVLFMEQWSSDTSTAWRQLSEFLGLQTIPTPEMEIQHVRKHDSGPVSPVAIDLLTQVYRPANAELQRWLGVPLPDWY